MSLRVWLPLNGTLAQNGSSNITATESGTTVNSNGKTGSCYEFSNNAYIALTGSDLYSIIKGGATPFSICFWVYHGDATRGVIFGDYGLSGTINFNIELTTGHDVRFFWNNGSPDKTFSSQSEVAASDWTHIAITYSGSLLTIYRDGINSTDTRSGALTEKNKTSGSFYIGRDNRTGTTAFNGRLNDFRLYDHCLSANEISAIVKGLVTYPYGATFACRCQLASGNFTANTPAALGVTLDANRFPVYVPVGGQGQGRTTGSGTVDLYLTNSDGTVEYPMVLDIPHTGAEESSPTTYSASSGFPAWNHYIADGLKGQALYISASKGIARKNAWNFIIYCLEQIETPTNVYCTTITSSDEVMLLWDQQWQNGEIKYYEIQYQDRASSSAAWGAWTDLTICYSNNNHPLFPINPNNNGQRQFRVRAVGKIEAQTSEWGYSTNICTSIAPSVNEGDVATAAQMNVLKPWRINQLRGS